MQGCKDADATVIDIISFQNAEPYTPGHARLNRQQFSSKNNSSTSPYPPRGIFSRL